MKRLFLIGIVLIIILFYQSNTYTNQMKEKIPIKSISNNEGQQAVANVILNRVKSNSFPNTIYDVIWQKIGKIYQFSPCGDGGINREPDERAIENAKIVLEGKRILPDDVLYFYMPTKGNKKNWIRSRKIFKKIGVHRFCF